MRPAIFVFLTLIVSPESVSCQSRDLSTVVRAALLRHYRWLEPSPKTSTSITCLFSPFPKQSFAFCEPLSLSMHIDNGSTTGLNVSFLNSEPHSHEAALKEFRRNINAAPPSGPTTLLTFSADDSATCSVDTKMTEYAASAVLTSDLRGMLHSKGLTLRSPVFCTGDPFSLLFAL